MYKILVYVNACELNDRRRELREFYYDSLLFGASKRRWESAFRELVRLGYLAGATLIPAKDGIVVCLDDDFGMTYAGELFLNQDFRMGKVK